MDMKLSGTRIKELRLKRSWSQERLAEEAGLNSRTVQRAESEGSASLRTRLQLAQALQVPPEELDAAQGSAPSPFPAGVMGMSIYHFTVLILVSVVYLGAQPAFFSLSVTNFSWINYGFGSYMPWPDNPVLWLMNGAVWALLTLPILRHVHKKHRSLFMAYVIAFSLGLGISVVRIWQPVWVAETMSRLLSLSGLALLLSLYTARLNTTLLRHGVYMCLTTYVFIWFFHGFVFFVANLYARMGLVNLGADPVSLLDPFRYLINTFSGRVSDLVQVIPLLLVVALSWGMRTPAPGHSNKTRSSPLESLAVN